MTDLSETAKQIVTQNASNPIFHNPRPIHAATILRNIATQPPKSIAHRSNILKSLPSPVNNIQQAPQSLLFSPLKRSKLTPATLILQQSHGNVRFFSLWNLPLALMTTSPLKRRLAFIGLGGASLALIVALGPFLLVGVGGIITILAIRFYRFRKNISSQLNNPNLDLNLNPNDWSNLLNTLIQQQQNSSNVFGKEQAQVQGEAIRRFKTWAASDQGRNQLIELGMYPEKVVQNVSMRGSSYSSTNVNGDRKTEVKIELDLKDSPGSILIALAELDQNGNIELKSMKLVTSTGQTLKVPVTMHSQTQGGTGRIIEGEFRNID